MPMRWVLTYLDDGENRLIMGPGGSSKCSYKTREEAEAAIQALKSHPDNEERLREIFQAEVLGTLEPRLVECWPGGDPKSRYV